MTVPFMENVCAAALCDNRIKMNAVISLKFLNTIKLLNIMFN
jgi:hypothetical protein